MLARGTGGGEGDGGVIGNSANSGDADTCGDVGASGDDVDCDDDDVGGDGGDCLLFLPSRAIFFGGSCGRSAWLFTGSVYCHVIGHWLLET